MNKAHILLAENDSDYRESMRRLLEIAGFWVTAIHSVQAAVEKLESMSWDLILVDWRLTHDDDQDQGGLEVLKKATERNIACIIISANGTVNTVRRSTSARVPFGRLMRMNTKPLITCSCNCRPSLVNLV